MVDAATEDHEEDDRARAEQTAAVGSTTDLLYQYLGLGLLRFRPPGPWPLQELTVHRSPFVRDHSGDLVDDLRQLVLSDSSCPRETHELPSPRQHEAAIWRAAHGHATAALELQHPLVAQLVEGAQHRVGVDAEDRGEVPGRRQALTRS